MLMYWISFIIGLWFFISGLAPGLVRVWNLLLVGILAIIFGLIAFYQNRKYWQGLVIAIIGLWVLICGFIEIYLVSWNFLLFGIIIAVLGLWAALASGKKSAPSNL